MNRGRRAVVGVLIVVSVIAVTLEFDSARAPFGTVSPSEPTIRIASPAADEIRPLNRPGITATGTIADEARIRLHELEKSALAGLPTVAAVRENSAADLHDVPAEVIAAGRLFGELSAFLARNPGLVRDALPTYSACANDSEAVPSIRALCAFRLRVYVKEWDEAIRAEYAKIPARIRELAKELDGTE